MRHVLPVLSLLTLAACYKTPLVNVAADQAPAERVRIVRVWNHSVLAGLVPLSEIDVRAACDGKEALAITTKMTFVNLILNGLTGAIYSPTTADIVCKY